MSINYKHLPDWLADSLVFRKLFLIKKLYIERAGRKYYSQFAEDIAIKRLFDDAAPGFFVDVGCYHPKKYNNTWQLYLDGWRGINIDIDPIKIEGFDIIRPNDVNIACAVSNNEGEVVYYSNGFYSLSVSMDKDFVAGKKKYREKKTRAYRLTTLIDNTLYKDRQIDLLSVDAEGYDIEVLKSLDFIRYNPKVVVTEAHFSTLDDLKLSPQYKFLVDKGYSMVGWSGLSLVFSNQEMVNLIKQKSAYNSR